MTGGLKTGTPAVPSPAIPGAAGEGGAARWAPALARGSRPAVVVLTGDLGSGKSALVQELAARVLAAGGRSHVIDVDTLAEAGDAVTVEPGLALLALDGCDALNAARIGRLRPLLRTALMAVPVVVLAGRRPRLADTTALLGGGGIGAVLRVQPLDGQAAAALAAAMGVNPAHRAPAVQLAGCNPLLLTVAADLARDGELAPWRLHRMAAPEVRRRLSSETGPAALDLLAVAALVPAVTEEGLSLLCGHPAGAAFGDLARLSVVEPCPEGIRVREPWRTVLAADLRSRRPDFVRDALNRRAAVALTSPPRPRRTPLVATARPDDDRRLRTLLRKGDGAGEARHDNLLDSFLRFAPDRVRIAGDPPVGFHAVAVLRPTFGDANGPDVAGLLVTADARHRDALVADLLSELGQSRLVAALAEPDGRWRLVALGTPGGDPAHSLGADAAEGVRWHDALVHALQLRALRAPAAPAAVRAWVRAALDAADDDVRAAATPLAGLRLPNSRLPRGAELGRHLRELILHLCASPDPREAQAGVVLRSHHLRRAGTCEQIAEQLHLSRPTMFRRLRSGTDMVAAAVAVELGLSARADATGPRP